MDQRDDDDDDEFIDSRGPYSKPELFNDAMQDCIRMLREFASALEYQQQFGDHRMLDAVDRCGVGFFRLAESCLEKERRANSSRALTPTTWEKGAGNTMYFRTRPRQVDTTT